MVLAHELLRASLPQEASSLLKEHANLLQALKQAQPPAVDALAANEIGVYLQQRRKFEKSSGLDVLASLSTLAGH